MTQTVITAGSASSNFSFTGGNDETLAIQVGAPGSQVNALLSDASGNITFPANLTTPGVITGNHSIVNNTGAVSDVSLLVGQTAYLTYTSATSVPLHITTGGTSGVLFEIYMINVNPALTTTLGSVSLNPNNTTYTNFIYSSALYGDTTVAANIASWVSTFILNPSGNGAVLLLTGTISTTSGAKSTQSRVMGAPSTSGGTITSVSSSVWVTTASTYGGFDTSVAWTSLGTLVFGEALTGTVYIRRLI